MSVPLTVPGTLDSLERIRLYVTEQAESAGLAKNAVYKLALAIDEIASNTISYGYERHDVSGDISVSSQSTEDEFIVTLEDTAPRYDPRGSDVGVEQEIKKPLEERSVGGLGVYLALTGVDRFEYEYADNRNRNIFAMRRGREGASQ